MVQLPSVDDTALVILGGAVARIGRWVLVSSQRQPRVCGNYRNLRGGQKGELIRLGNRERHVRPYHDDWTLLTTVGYWSGHGVLEWVFPGFCGPTRAPTVSTL